MQALERKGITPIGIFLGENPQDALRQLFPHLVVTQGQQLPEKLGMLFKSLTR